MPYEIKKSGSGYKVFKKGTKKSFSKKSLPKKSAQNQMKALYASEKVSEEFSVKVNLNFKKLFLEAIDDFEKKFKI